MTLTSIKYFRNHKLKFQDLKPTFSASSPPLLPHFPGHLLRWTPKYYWATVGRAKL